MKIKWLVLGLSVLVGLLILTGFMLYPKPPLKEIAIAREKLALAEKQKAAIYAKGPWLEAKNYYDAAMKSWGTENEKFFFLRSFDQTKALAESSIKAAETAEQEAKLGGKKMTGGLSTRLKNLGKQLDLFEGSYKSLPMSKKQINLLADSKLKYKELKNALTQGNTNKMEQKVGQLESHIGELVVFAKSTLEQYAKEVPAWKKMVNAAIETSRKSTTSLIVVDKYARECRIYNKGKLLAQYDVELGANWIGDKLKSGDKTTPEGNYKVVKKKANGQTKYYKALLLDYPNAEDKLRFKQNKERGLIPENATIGNLIEIHGEGGKGIDWTDGCVALQNEDIDKIWTVVKENTPVVIVCSLHIPSIND
ncbi:MAG TPA: L,D-transpeptidase family protein, partial [Roseivirga sp.]